MKVKDFNFKNIAAIVYDAIDEDVYCIKLDFVNYSISIDVNFHVTFVELQTLNDAFDCGGDLCIGPASLGEEFIKITIGCGIETSDLSTEV